MTYKLVTCLFLFMMCISYRSIAETGCSTYQGLYPNSMNTTHSTTGNVYYHNTNYIEYRTWDEDPRCGIRETKIISQGTACDVIGVRDYGVLVTYNPADNNCVVNAPLDNNIWLLLIILGLFSAFGIRKSILLVIQDS